MASPQPAIAIVGAGFGGICAAIQLRKAGFRSLVIFDKAPELGGTWQANTYPGVECDVPSHLYSYSFRLNGGWTRKWSPQPEILAYLQDCASHYGLGRSLRPGCEIVSCDFDSASASWTLRDASGAAHRFDFVVFALGQLSRPRRPAMAGLEQFGGECFHSAQWRHDCVLKDKSVAVIGNAASAVQFIPEIAPAARQLTIYQRSPNWMLRKNNRRYLGIEKWLASHVPGVARLYRTWVWLYAELLVYPLTGRNRRLKAVAERMTRRYLAQTVRDARLRDKLVPDYRFGAKRILFSDNYYAALDRSNVRVNTSPVRRIGEREIECEDGSRQAADVIILATGFETTRFLAPVRIKGKDGARLEDRWKTGAEAYLGITTADFPNFFMMYGPNTNLGHSSIIMMLECQARYIAKCLRKMHARGLTSVEVRADVEQAYNRRLAERLEKKAWAGVENSWYLHHGRNTNNWPGTTLEYWWRTRRFDLDDYVTAAGMEMRGHRLDP